MKPLTLSDSSSSAQIWNSAPQLDNIPVINTLSLVPAGARAVVIAPHPGDEVVTCGGLLQLLSSLGHPLQLLSITDGSASHPGSRQWSEKRLSVFRPQESVEALRRLGLPMHSLKWVRGGFTDNALCEQQAQVTEFISRYLRPGDVVFSTWRGDGNDGQARAAGAQLLLERGARWISCSDADSRVADDWLVAQLGLGADAVCGTVTVERWHESFDEAAQIRYHRDYRACDGHRHIHGANLGISADAYRWAGGFKPLACDEDVQLVRELERDGANIAWSHRPRTLR